MPLLTLILTLVVIGVLMWAINAYVPMAPNIKNLLNVVVIIAVVIWLLRAFGVWSYLSGVRV